jgi:hypothetical protein
MRALPLHDLDEVATKSDILLLRRDIEQLRTETHGMIDTLRAETHAMVDNLRSELLAVIATEIGSLRRSTYTSMVTLLIAIIAAMVGVRLLP